MAFNIKPKTQNKTGRFSKHTSDASVTPIRVPNEPAKALTETTLIYDRPPEVAELLTELRCLIGASMISLRGISDPLELTRAIASISKSIAVAVNFEDKASNDNDAEATVAKMIRAEMDSIATSGIAMLPERKKNNEE
jgi:hypothetical protein